MKFNPYHTKSYGFGAARPLTLASNDTWPQHEAISQNQYAMIVAVETPLFNSSEAVHGKIQKGDILFLSQSDVAKLLACIGHADKSPFIIQNVTANNLKLIKLLHEFNGFITVSRAIRASYPILNDTLDIIENHYDRDPKIPSSVLDRLLMILQSEALNALRLSQNPHIILSKALDEQKIAQALSLIHSAPTEDWSLARLAIEVKMPEAKFLDQFKKLIKIDPATYILKWRLQNSISLLDENELSLLQIARTSGFKSEAEFYQEFVDNFGFSPVQYRNKNIH